MQTCCDESPRGEGVVMVCAVCKLDDDFPQYVVASTNRIGVSSLKTTLMLH